VWCGVVLCHVIVMSDSNSNSVFLPQFFAFGIYVPSYSQPRFL
jgi:hypothetical protein